MAAGLALQATAIAWLAVILTPDVAYSRLIVSRSCWPAPGMALVFAPRPTRSSPRSRPGEAGQASGATNAIRELGGVLGVAVLASVFSAHGSYTSPQAYTAGLTAAIPIGAVVLAVGAVLALIVPKTAPAPEAEGRPSGANSRDRGKSDLGIVPAVGQPAKPAPEPWPTPVGHGSPQAMSTRSTVRRTGPSARMAAGGRTSISYDRSRVRHGSRT